MVASGRSRSQFFFTGERSGEGNFHIIIYNYYYDMLEILILYVIVTREQCYTGNNNVIFRPTTSVILAALV